MSMYNHPNMGNETTIGLCKPRNNQSDCTNTDKDELESTAKFKCFGEYLQQQYSNNVGIHQNTSVNDTENVVGVFYD